MNAVHAARTARSPAASLPRRTSTEGPAPQRPSQRVLQTRSAPAQLSLFPYSGAPAR